MDMYSQSTIRRKVLFGDLSNLSMFSCETPSWSLLVFISSTFTDTHVERDCLMGEILNKLREIGKQHSVSVSFSDMRWGVRDENTLEHETWVSCKKELLRCMKKSKGLFFISLQSEKWANDFNCYLFHQFI